MGFWKKAAGVFGRIGRGVKKGFDWLTANKEKIKSATDTIGEFIPSQYKGAYDSAISTGENLMNKAQRIIN